MDNSERLITELNDDNHMRIGTELGSGNVTSILGKGGFSTVYEIWNTKLEVKRAVKLVNPSVSPRSLGRFETEIKITAKLHHPNIIEIHNVGEWNGLPYIEMEIITGFSLKDVIARKGALPIEVATAIFILVCRALIYAHEQDILLYGKQRKGIVHCDIKPANIMITNEGIVKLTDFGLATPTDVMLHAEKENFSGTFHYASPEQLKMVQVDERTDIYSLNVVMYELYTGKRAFHGPDLDTLIQNRLNDVYVPIEVRCQRFNPAIKKIIQKNMSFDRDKRHSSVRELLADVEKIYAKITRVPPERIITDFFSKDDYPVLAKKYLRKRPLFLVTALIAFIGLLASFFFIKLNVYDTISAFSDRTSGNTSLQKDTIASVIKTASEPSDSHQTASDSVKPKQKAASPYSSLDLINAAIQKKEFAKAGKLLKAFPVEDGEYYFLYAHYLASEGSSASALSYVEKGFKIPAQRMSTDQHREAYMSAKAKCLTIAYDKTRDKEQGAKAMEAWFDVKYVLKGKQTSVQYKYADSEIRRIHEELQKISTN